MKGFKIDNINIPFDSEWKNICISLSGGADSALLAFLICDYIEKNNLKHIQIHVINHIRCWKTKPWQQYDSNVVFNWLFQKFYHINFVQHINFIAPELEYGNIGPQLTDEYGKKVSGDNIQQRAYAEFICNNYNIDAYYNAVTRNPKGLKFNGMPERDIDPTDENKHLVFMEHMGRYACHPFRFTDKSWIVAQYKNLNLMNLFEKTRSCEGEFKDLDYRTYAPGQYVPVCGKCFWCKEREWAIEQNK